MKIHFKSFIKLLLVLLIFLIIDKTAYAADTPGLIYVDTYPTFVFDGDTNQTYTRDGSSFYFHGGPVTSYDITSELDVETFMSYDNSNTAYNCIVYLTGSITDTLDSGSGTVHSISWLGKWDFHFIAPRDANFYISSIMYDSGSEDNLIEYNVYQNGNLIKNGYATNSTLDELIINVPATTGDNIRVTLAALNRAYIVAIPATSHGTAFSSITLLDYALVSPTPSPTPTATPTPAAGSDTDGSANSGNQVTIIGKLTQLLSDIASLPGRIATAIGGFFTDLGNSIVGALEALLQGILDGLEYLFIPDDFSGLIESNLEDLKDSMGILYIPIDLIERIFRVLTWHGSASLSFDGYTLPGYSDPIVPAFSYTFTLSDYLGSTYSYIISMILCASLIYSSAKTTLNHIFGTDVPDPINEGDED